MIFADRLILVLSLPMILFILQWYLCKKESKYAIFLPAIVACICILFGLPAFGVAAIMLLIYIIMTCILSVKKKKTLELEIEKMAIQDLE